MIRTKYSLDFLGLALLDERVEDDNVLALCAWLVRVLKLCMRSTYPRKTEEVRITVRTALGPVDLVQMLQWELELVREGLNACAQLALRERREFVEERLDERGVNEDHDDLESQSGAE